MLRDTFLQREYLLKGNLDGIYEKFLNVLYVLSARKDKNESLPF